MEAESHLVKPGLKLLDRFVLEKQIGKGGFCSVWAATDTTGELKVAAKCVQDPSHYSMREAEIYRDLSNTEGFAEYYGHCLQDNCFFILLERLHRDLFQFYRSKHDKFTEEYVYGLGVQMFDRIENLHRLGFVHRDLKPSQFMLKRQSPLLYLVDFNLSRKFPKSFGYVSQHKGGIVGNVIYASLSAHSIEQQTRRDDCESLLYIILYLIKGSLPWQGVLGKGREQIGQVASIKTKTPISELCRDLPIEFAALISKARSMTFEEAPDYAFFKHSLEAIQRKAGLKMKLTVDTSKLSNSLYSLQTNSLMSASMLTCSDCSPTKLDTEVVATDTSIKPLEESPVPKKYRLIKKATRKLKRTLPKGLNRDALRRSMEFCGVPEEIPEEEVSAEVLESVSGEIPEIKENCLVF